MGRFGIFYGYLFCKGEKDEKHTPLSVSIGHFSREAKLPDYAFPLERILISYLFNFPRCIIGNGCLLMSISKAVRKKSLSGFPLSPEWAFSTNTAEIRR